MGVPLRIELDRLVLREWRDADVGPFAAICADPTVMAHFPATLTRAEAAAFVDRARAAWERDGVGLWAVELTDRAPTGPAAFVGFVGLAPAEVAGDDLVEVGWRLAHAHWGNGYAPEAATAALAVAFLALGRDEVVSFTTAGNLPSQRVMDKIGMRRDPGRDFDHPRVDPATHPHLVRHLLWSIGRDEFLALHADHV